MSNELLYTPETYFLCSETAERPRKGLNLIGAGFDGTACFRKGAVDGPDAIRQVSDQLETYSPYLNLDLEEVETFCDLGNLAVSRSGDVRQDWNSIEEAFSSIVEIAPAASRFITMGGEHSISYFFIKRCLTLYQDLVLLHLDAHADLRDGYQGFDYSHAAVIRRCLDNFGEGHRLVQYGIRSGTRDEFDWMRREKTIFSGFSDFIGFIGEINPERPIYLTLDLDYFDPAFMPGTGTPEAGGEDFRSFVEIVKVLKGKNLVGADVVELAPRIDPTNNSAVFAAKVVRELILAMTGKG